MLSSFKNMFRIPDLRKKILFTIFIVAAYRFGAHIPVPGVSIDALKQIQAQRSDQGVVALLDLFSGGALTNFSLFALGIMPYITSSIIMQLLGVVIPKLEQWREEGETGQKKITQWTRYLTVALAVMQSAGISYLAHTGQLFGQLGTAGGAEIKLIPVWTAPRIAIVVLTLTAGTAMVMWLGELITQRGIGNGMSILIFASIISRLPYQGAAVYRAGMPKFITILALLVGMVVAIIFVDQGQRRIPVQFAKRVVGRKMMGGNTTYIPLKVNSAGVIPIIFASSILYFPTLIATTLPWEGFRDWVNRYLANQGSVVYMGLYFSLIIFFAYFYTAIQFDPVRQADMIKKQGGFIPGIRPGKSTAEYFDHILTRITLPGSIYLGVIALIPSIVFAVWKIGDIPFGGASMLIVVGVALETMKQIESQLMMRNYEGFLS